MFASRRTTGESNAPGRVNQIAHPVMTRSLADSHPAQQHPAWLTTHFNSSNFLKTLYEHVVHAAGAHRARSRWVSLPGSPSPFDSSWGCLSTVASRLLWLLGRLRRCSTPPSSVQFAPDVTPAYVYACWEGK